jgi:GNAT superfamily N-acetyltransferase
MRSSEFIVERRDAMFRDEITEAFDYPYKLKWEKSSYGDIDASATLDDGNYLNISFNRDENQDGKLVWNVEFDRNYSQAVTGEGDAQRVFATVLSAIQIFIKKYKPLKLAFGASKVDDQGQNSQSRARLYDSLVQRYARAWGYRVFRADTGNLVVYEFSRIQKPKAVGEDYNNRFAKEGVAEGVKLGRQRTNEKINPEILSRKFRKQKDLGWYRLEAQGDALGRAVTDPPTLKVVAKLVDKSKPENQWIEIGDAEFFEAPKEGPYAINNTGDGGLIPEVSVHPEYQRKGIATEIYKFIRELGNDIVRPPSGSQSDDAVGLWGSFQKQGVAEAEVATKNSNEIWRQLRAAGYHHVGSGADATVFAKDDSHVIKILMPEDAGSKAEQVFRKFYEFSISHQNLPCVPRFNEVNTIDINGKDYTQIEMERLSPIEKGSFLQGMVWLLSDYAIENKPWSTVERELTDGHPWYFFNPNYSGTFARTWQSLLENPASEKTYSMYKQLYAVMQLLYTTGTINQFGWDLHTANVMQRTNGQPVIIDPWFSEGTS